MFDWLSDRLFEFQEKQYLKTVRRLEKEIDRYERITGNRFSAFDQVIPDDKPINAKHIYQEEE